MVEKFPAQRHQWESGPMVPAPREAFWGLVLYRGESTAAPKDGTVSMER